MSISGQTHEFIIYAMCQRTRADNLTTTNWSQLLMRLSCYWQWISAWHCQSSLRSYSYFDNVMTKFMINNTADAWETDVNLLIFFETWLKLLLLASLFCLHLCKCFLRLSLNNQKTLSNIVFAKQCLFLNPLLNEC